MARPEQVKAPRKDRDGHVAGSRRRIRRLAGPRLFWSPLFFKKLFLSGRQYSHGVFLITRTPISARVSESQFRVSRRAMLGVNQARVASAAMNVQLNVASRLWLKGERVFCHIQFKTKLGPCVGMIYFAFLPTTWFVHSRSFPLFTCSLTFGRWNYAKIT